MFMNSFSLHQLEIKFITQPRQKMSNNDTFMVPMVPTVQLPVIFLCWAPLFNSFLCFSWEANLTHSPQCCTLWYWMENMLMPCTRGSSTFRVCLYWYFQCWLVHAGILIKNNTMFWTIPVVFLEMRSYLSIRFIFNEERTCWDVVALLLPGLHSHSNSFLQTRSIVVEFCFVLIEQSLELFTKIMEKQAQP